MMGELLFGALALMLIFEGLLPFVSPAVWRQAFERALKLTDGQIRFLGMAAILLGLFLLSVWR